MIGDYCNLLFFVTEVAQSRHGFFQQVLVSAFMVMMTKQTLAHSNRAVHPFFQFRVVGVALVAQLWDFGGELDRSRKAASLTRAVTHLAVLARLVDKHSRLPGRRGPVRRNSVDVRILWALRDSRGPLLQWRDTVEEKGQDPVFLDGLAAYD
jgi:hypothetical protein